MNRKVIIILGWIMVWAVLSRLIHNQILLVGPLETLCAMSRLVTEMSFWEACAGTLMRITAGFLAGMILGIIFAMLSVGHRLVEEILAPVIALMKAVPVASVVVIFLIWWNSANLAIAISFVVVFPNFYLNTVEGIRSTDVKKLEMAQVFCMPGWNRFFYVYRPAIGPFWDGAVKLSTGMSWKAGVAAEVIGLPASAIGERLYMSKIYLETDGVFAWTVVIILLSILFEKAVLVIWGLFLNWQPGCKSVPGQTGKQLQPVQLQQVSVSYHNESVLRKVTSEYKPQNVYYLNSPSGSGKTTLLRVIAGLQKPDEGIVDTKCQKVAMLFQEDRLCEEYSALKNVELVATGKSSAREHLLQLLGEEEILKPCRELSGGMKRRVALARAFASDANIILLDEPYNGLDKENRIRVREYIDKNRGDRIVLLAGHIQPDTEKSMVCSVSNMDK